MGRLAADQSQSEAHASVRPKYEDKELCPAVATEGGKRRRTEDVRNGRSWETTAEDDLESDDYFELQRDLGEKGLLGYPRGKEFDECVEEFFGLIGRRRAEAEGEGKDEEPEPQKESEERSVEPEERFVDLES